VPSPSQLIDTMIAKTPGWRGETLAKLRTTILDADPEMIEEVKWKKPSNPMGVPVWEHDGNVCIANILKERVRLTFPAGASLPDPKKLFNARLDSGSVRAIDVSEGDKVNAAALKALIRAGAKHNQAKTKAAGKKKR